MELKGIQEKTEINKLAKNSVSENLLIFFVFIKQTPSSNFVYEYAQLEKEKLLCTISFRKILFYIFTLVSTHLYSTYAH